MRPILTRSFARHYAEMVVVMLVGMGVLALPSRWLTDALFPGVDGDDPALMLARMAVAMTIPMVPRMRFRGHGWPASQLVVKIEHRRKEPRPQLEGSAGQPAATPRGSRGPREQDFALGARERRPHGRVRLVQSQQPFIARHQVGQEYAWPAGAARVGFDRAAE